MAANADQWKWRQIHSGVCPDLDWLYFILFYSGEASIHRRRSNQGNCFTQMNYDYTTNSPHYLAYTFSFKGLGECTCWAANLLLLPLNHIISLISCAFAEMRENPNLCTVCVVLNAVMLGPVLNRVRNYSTFSLTGFTKIYVWNCVLNRVRISLSRPNPPTYIPVEYTPPPPGTAPTTVLTCSPLPFSLFPMGNTFVTNVLVPFSTESSLQTRTAERVVKCGLKPNL